MRRFRLFTVALSLAALLVAPAPVAAALPLTPVEGGFSMPIFLTHARDARLFVVEQRGLIKIIGGGTFLDLTGLVSQSGFERGLLGLAFHPSYASNGLFYVNYTRQSDGDIVIAEYRRSTGNPDVADPNSKRIVLKIEHSSATNHNGGWMAFKKDKLYISVGDGGASAQPAQDLSSMLGKILRIVPVDPDGTGPLKYSVPPGNPYVETRGLDEIWSYGLRNPWRCSFDRVKGKLYCGDVGAGAWEEIDRSDTGKGKNYGWPLLEGTHYYSYPGQNQGDPCTGGCKTLPILEFAHSVPGDDNSAVTGGYVSRRSGATLYGQYVFGDWGSGRVWAVPANFQAGSPLPSPLADTSYQVSSFGEGFDRRLYLIDWGDGVVYRLNGS